MNVVLDFRFAVYPSTDQPVPLVSNWIALIPPCRCFYAYLDKGLKRVLITVHAAS